GEAVAGHLETVLRADVLEDLLGHADRIVDEAAGVGDKQHLLHGVRRPGSGGGQPQRQDSENTQRTHDGLSLLERGCASKARSSWRDFKERRPETQTVWLARRRPHNGAGTSRRQNVPSASA